VKKGGDIMYMYHQKAYELLLSPVRTNNTNPQEKVPKNFTASTAQKPENKRIYYTFQSNEEAKDAILNIIKTCDQSTFSWLQLKESEQSGEEDLLFLLSLTNRHSR